MVRTVREPDLSPPSTSAGAAPAPPLKRTAVRSRIPLPPSKMPRTALARHDHNRHALPPPKPGRERVGGTQLKPAAPTASPEPIAARVTRSRASIARAVAGHSAAQPPASPGRHLPPAPESAPAKPKRVNTLAIASPVALASTPKAQAVRTTGGETHHLARTDETPIGKILPPSDMASLSEWSDGSTDGPHTESPPPTRRGDKAVSGAGRLITPASSRLHLLQSRPDPPQASTSTVQRPPSPESQQPLNDPQAILRRRPRKMVQRDPESEPEIDADADEGITIRVEVSPTERRRNMGSPRRSATPTPKTAAKRKSITPPAEASKRRKSGSQERPTTAGRWRTSGGNIATNDHGRTPAPASTRARSRLVDSPPLEKLRAMRLHAATVETRKLRKTMTPSQRKLLKDTQVGILAAPISVTPGPDPLHLSPGPRRGERRSRSATARPRSRILASGSTARKITRTEGSFLKRRGGPEEQREEDLVAYGDVSGIDLDVDDDEVGNDTFVGLNTRRAQQGERVPSALARPPITAGADSDSDGNERAEADGVPDHDEPVMPDGNEVSASSPMLQNLPRPAPASPLTDLGRFIGDSPVLKPTPVPSARPASPSPAHTHHAFIAENAVAGPSRVSRGSSSGSPSAPREPTPTPHRAPSLDSEPYTSMSPMRSAYGDVFGAASSPGFSAGGSPVPMPLPDQTPKASISPPLPSALSAAKGKGKASSEARDEPMSSAVAITAALTGVPVARPAPLAVHHGDEALDMEMTKDLIDLASEYDMMPMDQMDHPMADSDYSDDEAVAEPEPVEVLPDEAALEPATEAPMEEEPVEPEGSGESEEELSELVDVTADQHKSSPAPAEDPVNIASDDEEPMDDPTAVPASPQSATAGACPPPASAAASASLHHSPSLSRSPAPRSVSPEKKSAVAEGGSKWTRRIFDNVLPFKMATPVSPPAVAHPTPTPIPAPTPQRGSMVDATPSTRRRLIFRPWDSATLTPLPAPQDLAPSPKKEERDGDEDADESERVLEQPVPADQPSDEGDEVQHRRNTPPRSNRATSCPEEMRVSRPEIEEDDTAIGHGDSDEVESESESEPEPEAAEVVSPARDPTTSPPPENQHCPPPSSPFAPLASPSPKAEAEAEAEALIADVPRDFVDLGADDYLEETALQPEEGDKEHERDSVSEEEEPSPELDGADNTVSRDMYSPSYIPFAALSIARLATPLRAPVSPSPQPAPLQSPFLARLPSRLSAVGLRAPEPEPPTATSSWPSATANGFTADRASVASPHESAEDEHADDEPAEPAAAFGVRLEEEDDASDIDPADDTVLSGDASEMNPGDDTQLSESEDDSDESQVLARPYDDAVLSVAEAERPEVRPGDDSLLSDVDSEVQRGEAVLSAGESASDAGSDSDSNVDPADDTVLSDAASDADDEGSPHDDIPLMVVVASSPARFAQPVAEAVLHPLEAALPASHSDTHPADDTVLSDAASDVEVNPRDDRRRDALQPAVHPEDDTMVSESQSEVNPADDTVLSDNPSHGDPADNTLLVSEESYATQRDDLSEDEEEYAEDGNEDERERGLSVDANESADIEDEDIQWDEAQLRPEPTFDIDLENEDPNPWSAPGNDTVISDRHADLATEDGAYAPTDDAPTVELAHSSSSILGNSILSRLAQRHVDRPSPALLPAGIAATIAAASVLRVVPPFLPSATLDAENSVADGQEQEQKVEAEPKPEVESEAESEAKSASDIEVESKSEIDDQHESTPPTYGINNVVQALHAAIGSVAEEAADEKRAPAALADEDKDKDEDVPAASKGPTKSLDDDHSGSASGDRTHDADAHFVPCARTPSAASTPARQAEADIFVMTTPAIFIEDASIREDTPPASPKREPVQEVSTPRRPSPRRSPRLSPEPEMSTPRRRSPRLSRATALAPVLGTRGAHSLAPPSPNVISPVKRGRSASPTMPALAQEARSRSSPGWDAAVPLLTAPSEADEDAEDEDDALELSPQRKAILEREATPRRGAISERGASEDDGIPEHEASEEHEATREQEASSDREPTDERQASLECEASPMREPTPVRGPPPAAETTPTHELVSPREPSSVRARRIGFPVERSPAANNLMGGAHAPPVSTPLLRRSTRLSCPAEAVPLQAPLPESRRSARKSVTFTQSAAFTQHPSPLLPYNTSPSFSIQFVNGSPASSPGVIRKGDPPSLLESPLKSLTFATPPHASLSPTKVSGGGRPGSSPSRPIMSDSGSGSDIGADETMEAESGAWDISAGDILMINGTRHFTDHEITDQWDATQIPRRSASRSITPGGFTLAPPAGTSTETEREVPAGVPEDAIDDDIPESRNGLRLVPEEDDAASADSADSEEEDLEGALQDYDDDGEDSHGYDAYHRSDHDEGDAYGHKDQYARDEHQLYPPPPPSASNKIVICLRPIEVVKVEDDEDDEGGAPVVGPPPAAYIDNSVQVKNEPQDGPPPMDTAAAPIRVEPVPHAVSAATVETADTAEVVEPAPFEATAPSPTAAPVERPPSVDTTPFEDNTLGLEPAVHSTVPLPVETAAPVPSPAVTTAAPERTAAMNTTQRVHTSTYVHGLRPKRPHPRGLTGPCPDWCTGIPHRPARARSIPSQDSTLPRPPASMNPETAAAILETHARLSTPQLATRLPSLYPGNAAAGRSRLPDPGLASPSTLPAVLAAHEQRRAHLRADERTLQDEMTMADEEEEEDERVRAVVEVASWDPEAAARAAAILKVNHQYIEHGILPDGTLDLSKLPRRAHSRAGSVASRRSHANVTRAYEAGEGSRMYNKDELLRQAEYELSSANLLDRTRMASEDPTEREVPGGWHKSVKRKRVESWASNVSLAETASWTKREWKRLEAVLVAEQANFIAQASKRQKDAPRAWSADRVVDAFLRSEGLTREEAQGEWAWDVLLVRVEALEVRLLKKGERRSVAGTFYTEPEIASAVPKRLKVNVKDSTKERRKDRAATPPSTLKKVMGWMFPRKRESDVEEGVSERDEDHAEQQDANVFRGPEQDHADSHQPHAFLNRRDESFDGDITMAQTPSRPITGALPNVPRAAPQGPSQRPRRSSSNAGPTHPYSYAYASNSEDYAYGNMAPSSSRRLPLYPPLYPTLPQRSAALEHSTAPGVAPGPAPRIVSGTPRPRPRVRSGEEFISPPLPPRQGAAAGVRTLARHFEETATRDLSFRSDRREREKGTVGAIGRVRQVRERVEDSSFDSSFGSVAGGTQHHQQQ